MVQADKGDEWIVHGQRSIYESEWVRVGLADISRPSGDRFEHHTVWLPPAAMTVVIDDAGENVLLAYRHRFVPDVWNYELPGGLIDENESPDATASREVEEEAGYRLRTIEHLVTFEPMIGTVHNPHHVFLSRGAEKVGNALEVNEGKYEWVPIKELRKLISSGDISNSGTLVGVLHFLAFEHG